MQGGRKQARRGVPSHVTLGGLVAWLVVLAAAPTFGDDRPRIERAEVGIGGKHKVGYWTPVRVEATGLNENRPLTLEATVVDSDALPVTYVLEQALRPSKDSVWRGFGYVKFGRARTGLTVRIKADDRVVVERRWRADELPAALDVHQPLIVSLPKDVTIESATRYMAHSEAPAVAAVVEDPATLPDRWFGYEGVQTLIIGTSDRTWLDKLSARQLAAIDQWIRLGGRLILGAGRQAADLQALGAPWSGWIPGQIEEVVSLRRAAGVESYATAEQRLLGARGDSALSFALLAQVRGRVESHESIPTRGDRPLVVCHAVGFGHVTFVAIDLDTEPVASWTGRPRLLAKILQANHASQQVETPPESQGQVSHLGFDDLSGQLRSALDQFAGVSTIPFGWIVTLIIGYIALIGPLDFFLHRKLGRAEATWITFPLAAIGCAALAVWLGGRSQETRLRLNQVDVVDVDAATGLVRGTTWLNIYSPSSASSNWTFDDAARESAERGTSSQEFLASWQGVPGRGVGALQGGAATLMTSGAYSIRVPAESDGATNSPIVGAKDEGRGGASVERSTGRIESLPVAVAGTRCLSGRWQGVSNLKIDAHLKSDAIDGQLQGRFRNPWPFRLTDWALLRGNWMYRAQRELEPGDEVSIAEFAGARYFDWHLTQRRVGADAKDFTVPWDNASLEVPRIVEMMLFHGAAGGSSYTRIASHYQSYLDLTDHLRSGQAVLIGRGPAAYVPTRDGQFTADSHDQQLAVYRVVLPVEISTRSNSGR